MISTNQLVARVLWALAVLGVICLFLLTHAKAMDWHGADQVTMSWDPVTTLSDGTPAPAGEITYTVWVENAADASETEIASGIAGTSYTFTFGAEGKYILGVQTVRTVDGVVLESSSISWSDDPLVAVPDAWGVIHYLPPANATGLQKE